MSPLPEAEAAASPEANVFLWNWEGALPGAPPPSICSRDLSETAAFSQNQFNTPSSPTGKLEQTSPIHAQWTQSRQQIGTRLWRVSSPPPPPLPLFLFSPSLQNLLCDATAYCIMARMHSSVCWWISNFSSAILHKYNQSCIGRCSSQGGTAHYLLGQRHHGLEQRPQVRRPLTLLSATVPSHFLLGPRTGLPAPLAIEERTHHLGQGRGGGPAAPPRATAASLACPASASFAASAAACKFSDDLCCISDIELQSSRSCFQIPTCCIVASAVTHTYEIPDKPHTLQSILLQKSSNKAYRLRNKV